MHRNARTDFRSRSASLLGRTRAASAMLAAAGFTALALTGGSAIAQDAAAKKFLESGEMAREPIEVDSSIRRPATLRATLTPIKAPQAPPPGATRGTAECPPVVDTLSSANFEGGSFVLQAGFVENEMLAASYTADPAEFPLIIRTTEMILAQQSATVTTTTHWSVIVWEGTPDTGTIVAEFSSDDVILPHAVMPPGTRGVNIQVTVDPQDPDQIVVQDNGTQTFTIGYRIDQHNNPPTTSCNFGLTQPECCPPPTSSNAFPTTDTPPGNNPNFPSQNWLYCLPGCQPAGFTCPGGWHRFSELGAFRPSGDWNIRVTYERFDCPNEPIGACCFSDGSCENAFQSTCIGDGGTYQGDGTDCNIEGCPDPVGACCFFPDTGGPSAMDCISETEAECATRHDPDSNMYSYWNGPGTVCEPGQQCPDDNALRGGCCFDGGSCVNLLPLDCIVAGGDFRGEGTDCGTIVCNPFGACCMPDGSCSDQFEADCDAMGGVFQGNDNLCASVSCPQPTGACCLSSGNCINETEANCTAIPGASWAGMGTDCGDADMNGAADDCEEDPAIGACCLDSGNCIVEGEANCLNIPGATYMGDGTDCTDADSSGTADACEQPVCPADIADSNGAGSDGTVNLFDLLLLLDNWGTGGAGAAISSEGGGASVVDLFDLLAMLDAWGDC